MPSASLWVTEALALARASEELRAESSLKPIGGAKNVPDCVEKSEAAEMAGEGRATCELSLVFASGLPRLLAQLRLAGR